MPQVIYYPDCSYQVLLEVVRETSGTNYGESDKREVMIIREDRRKNK